MTTAMQGKARLNQLPKRLITAAKEFNEEDMLYYAAALSFQVFFSLFPFLFFVLALLGSLNIPGFWDWLLDQAQAVLPEQPGRSSRAYGRADPKPGPEQQFALFLDHRRPLVSLYWGANDHARSQRRL